MKRLKDDSDRDVQQIAEGKFIFFSKSEFKFSLEWLFDEEDDPDFIPLCPEEIEANLPNGQMSFRVKPKSLLIKNSATGSKYLSNILELSDSKVQ